MGARDKGKSEASIEPAGTLSLLDAIQQTVRTREMLGDMQQRVQSLQKQRANTRQKVMLDQLEREYEVLKQSVRVIASEFEKMARFFSELEIVVNGKKILAEEAVKVLMSLKQHLEGLKNLTKNLELETHGISALELNAEVIKKSGNDCIDAWQKEFSSYVLILEMIKIPDRATDLFESVWTDRNQAVRMHIRWSQSTQQWVLTQGMTAESPNLIQYLKDAAAFAIMEGLPDGYEAVLECTTDEYGKSRFNIHVKRPGGSYGADPYPFATGNSGGSARGSAGGNSGSYGWNYKSGTDNSGTSSTG